LTKRRTRKVLTINMVKKHHSLTMAIDGSKRHCPTCGVATYKKGGILGKKSIPITLEGRVYQGRCLACDPFPPRLVPNAAAIPAAIPTAIPTTCHTHGEKEPSQPRRLLSNISRKTAKSSPPTAIVTSAESAAKIPTASSRLKSDRSFEDAEREHHRELYQESGENGYGKKAFGRKNSLDSRMRELQYYQQQQRQQQHFQQSDHRPLQAIPINDDYNKFDTVGIEANAPLSSTRVSQSRAVTGRAVVSSSAKATPSGVPKTLEVIRRGPPRGGNSTNSGNGYSNSSLNSNNFGDDHSVVSAITMDINLFQSVVGSEEIYYEDTNAIDDDLPPPTFHRRPGPEQLAGRSYHTSRNHKNQRNAFNAYERRHSIGGDVDSYRRFRHHSANSMNNSSGNQNGIHEQNRHLYAPSAITRDLSPSDEFEDGTPAYHYGDNIVPNRASEKNTSSLYRTRSQESEFRSEENFSKRLKNHSTHTQPVRTSSMIGHTETNRHRSYHGIPENHIVSSNGDEFGAHGPIGLSTGNHDDHDDDLPSFIMDDDDYHDEHGYNQNILHQKEQQQCEQLGSNDRINRTRELEQGDDMVPQATVTPASSTSSGARLNNTNGTSHLKKSPHISKTIIEERDINDLPGILRCLNLEECNPDIREQSLCKLVEIMKSTGKNLDAIDRERHIQELTLENDVIEAVTKSMWADMTIVEVQEAAMDVFLFIAASMESSYSRDSSDGGTRYSNSNLLCKNESVCDSILFAMQNHPPIHGIQLKGCLLFASLSSSSSSDNNNVGSNSDGSLSGAMAMVLNAMSNHGDSRSIRKAGLQALHHQCLLSAFAGDNKRTFVESKLGNGMPAIDLIVYAMEELQKDVVAMEWACELSWCLTTNADLLKLIEHTSLHEGTMTICQHYMTNPAGIGLVEASIGTIANLAKIARKRNEMINTGAVELVLDGLRYHGDSFGICYEAALALENFALPPYLPGVSSMLLKSQAVPLLIRGLKKFLDYPEYVIQGLRALTGIAARSDEAKRRIGSPEIISIVHKSSQKHKNENVTEICCLFIATLAMGKAASIGDCMIEHRVLDLLLYAMESFPNEKVQDAACLALRNLSCHIQKSEKLLEDGKTLKLIVNAMDTHRNSLSIQSNGCCVFWNLLSKTNKKSNNFNPKIANSIIKAMQSHIESANLLEQACGALWVIVDNFDDQKLYVGSEAIDVVTCAMVMHPGTASTLEKACGFLSNLSSVESLARIIAKAQGVSIVSEAMCNNASSISLLESGCLTLKNIILVCPNYAQDAAVAISTLIMAMNENIGSASFVKEACNMVWVLASENESIRSKVLALDGISTLMKCLEQNSNHPDVEAAALGAFNQLAKS